MAGHKRQGDRPGIQSLLTSTAPVTPEVGSVPGATYQWGSQAEALYQSQNRSVIWPSVVAAIVAAGFVTPRVTNANAPQSVDLTQQGWIRAPLAGRQGAVQRMLLTVPQVDQTPLKAQVFPVPNAAAITANPIASFFVTLPQYEDRPTAIVWSSQKAGQTPPVIRALSAPPQSYDYTLPAQFSRSVIGPSRPLPFLIGAPQSYDYTLPALLIAPSVTPAVITGVTVFPLPSVMPQPDVSINYSTLWTPSTFSASAPPLAPVVDIALGPMGPMSASIGFVEPKRKKKHYPEPTPEVIEAPTVVTPRESFVLADIIAPETVRRLTELKTELKATQESVKKAQASDDESIAIILLGLL